MESSSFNLHWIPVSSSADVTQPGLGGIGTEIGSAVHAFFLISSFHGLVWVQAYIDYVG